MHAAESRGIGHRMAEPPVMHAASVPPAALAGSVVSTGWKFTGAELLHARPGNLSEKLKRWNHFNHGKKGRSAVRQGLGGEPASARQVMPTGRPRGGLTELGGINTEVRHLDQLIGNDLQFVPHDLRIADLVLGMKGLLPYPEVVKAHRAPA